MDGLPWRRPPAIVILPPPDPRSLVLGRRARRTDIAGFTDSPDTLRERAALFLGLATQAIDPVGEEALTILARLYLEDALELERLGAQDR